MTRGSSIPLVALLSMAIGCGTVEEPRPPSDPPKAPTLNPGMATLRGKVVDASRQPVAGATVTVLDAPALEAPRVATSGTDGTWELSVPGATTISVRAEAMALGFAPTRTNAFLIPKGQTSSELELMMVAPTYIEQMSAIMGGARVGDYGLLAVEVRSLGPCDPTGGKIVIEPTQLGKVLYSKANEAAPDSTLTTIQAGARPAAWLLGVLPPGSYYRVRFEKAGCTEKAWPVDFQGRSYDGKLPIASKELSHGLLFVD